MQKRFSFFGGASILYALFYTFCMYRNASGITYPFFAAGTLVYFYLCTVKSGVPWKKDSLFYVVSILLLGISVFLTDNQSIIWITKGGILLLLISLMLHQYLDDRKWTFSKFLMSIGQGILETVACLGHPFSDGEAWLRNSKKDGKAGKGRYVALGILILIPLLLVVLALLVSADSVFRNVFVRIFEHIDMAAILIILFMTAGMFLVSYCFVAMLNKRVIKEECTENRNQEPVTAITVTSVLAIVYLVFCVIQIVYLFPGKALGQAVLPDGNYASYARQGFFQLLAVCIINLGIVLVCISFFRESRILKGILVIISLCTYVMTASSAYRMILYIGECHLTFLRVIVLWALAVIAIVFAGILLTICRPQFPLFKYTMTVVTVCYILLAFAKPDYWIARYDVNFLNREEAWQQSAGYSGEEQDGYFWDYRYLSRLSADAAPVLAKEENYEFLSENSRAMVEYYNEIEWDAEDMGLRSFNLSRYLAAREVAQRREE